MKTRATLKSLRLAKIINKNLNFQTTTLESTFFPGSAAFSIISKPSVMKTMVKERQPWKSFPKVNL